MPAFLLTGAAGFIGHWVARQLLDGGAEVLGIDNLNDAYDPRIKTWRLARLQRRSGFRFMRVDIADRAALEAVSATAPFDAVLHLAARARAHPGA